MNERGPVMWDARTQTEQKPLHKRDTGPTPANRENEAVTYEILDNFHFRELFFGRVAALADQLHSSGTDTVFFLDKSARPICWLFKDVWQKQFPNDPVPQIRYLNIGRTEDRGPYYRPGTVEHLKERLQSGLEGLTSDIARQQFQSKLRQPLSMTDARGLDAQAALNRLNDEDDKQCFHDLAAKVRKTYSHPDKGTGVEFQHIALIDELSEIGTSQLLASTLLAEAFPDAQVQSTSIFAAEESKSIPWLQKQGMTGVIEVSPKSLLTGAVTELNIEQTKLRFEKIFLRQVKECYDNELYCLDAAKIALEEVLPNISISDEKQLTPLPDKLQVFLNGLFNSIVSKEKETSRFSHRLPEESLSQYYLRTKRFFDEKKVWHASIAEDYDRLSRQNPQFNTAKLKEAVAVLHGSSSYNLHLSSQTEETLRALDNVPAIIAKAKQLRREIKKLGQE